MNGIGGDVCTVVPEGFGRDIKDMLHKTLSDGNERGFFILSKDKGLDRSHTSIGAGHSVQISMFNPFGIFGEPIGTIHTHPNQRFDQLISITDAGMLLNGEFEFIGIAYREARIDKLAIFTAKEFKDLKGAVIGTTEPDELRGKVNINLLVRNLNSALRECEVRL